MEKIVFIVFYAGERAKAKIMKICEAFGANRYPFPEETPKQLQMRAEVKLLYVQVLLFFINPSLNLGLLCFGILQINFHSMFFFWAYGLRNMMTMLVVIVQIQPIFR